MRALVVITASYNIAWERFASVANADILVVDDSGDSVTRTIPPIAFTGEYVLATNNFQRRYLPTMAHGLISSEGPSRKNFGLYYAWKEGYDRVLLLDEVCDTRPTPDFLSRIPLGNIIQANRIKTISGWYNPLWQLHGFNTQLYARGYPYELRVTDRPQLYEQVSVCPKFNQGLWLGYPDINALDMISLKSRTKLELETRPTVQNGQHYRLFSDPAVIIKRQHLPMSCANVQLYCDLIPAFYQPPDFPVYDRYIVSNHADIWSMYILKIFMDMKGDKITVGEPLVYRHRSHHYMKESIRENCSHILQTTFVDAVDHAARYVQSGTYLEMAEMMAEALDRQGEKIDGRWGEIISAYASYLAWWTRLFREGK